MPFYWHAFIGGVEPPFFVPKKLFLSCGVTAGVTKWGYTFRKVGLQKWVLWGLRDIGKIL